MFGGAPKPDTSQATESLRLQREQTAELKKQAEEDKRTAGEDYAAKRKSLARGGKRSLLADNRLNPETGIDDDDSMPTLGA